MFKITEEEIKKILPSKGPSFEEVKGYLEKYNDEYIDKIRDDLGVAGSPRFYWQEPNSTLPMHVDNNTTCSINFVVTDNPAPVTVEEVDYVYEQAILNTTKLHGVNTNEEERILLKISVFDESYEDLIQRIPYIT